MFINHDYHVDFLGYNLKIGDFVSQASLNHKKLNVIEFQNIDSVFNKKNNFIGRIKNKTAFRKFKSKTNQLFNSNHIKVDRKVLLDAYNHLRTKKYDFYIGIEKQGLIWSGLLGEKFNIPTIYYSLELYINDHPMLEYQGHLRNTEKYFHNKSLATIIQDEFRKKALFEANEVNNDAIYLPVSVPGPSIKKKSFFLYEKFNIPKDKKIALFFGGMAPQRYCEEIIQAAQKLHDDVVVVFHGFEMTDGYIKFLKTVDVNNKIIFSLDKLPEEELTDLLCSADIGFAIYSNDNVNDRYTAFSSQKIALFLKHGIPIVSNHNESYTRLFEEFKCGENISEFISIEQAIMNISDSLDSYRDSSFMAFNKHFNLDHLEEKLITTLDNLLNKNV
jgi:glycosyltransferase involved in cell wall biosynthesis